MNDSINKTSVINNRTDTGFLNRSHPYSVELTRLFLYLYIITVPLGTMLRFGAGFGFLGISTVLVFILVFLGAFHAIPTVFNESIFRVLLAFGIWIGVMTVFADPIYDPSLNGVISFLMYIFFSACIAIFAYNDRSDNTIKQIYFLAALSATVFSTIVLTDYYGITNFGLGSLKLTKSVDGDGTQLVPMLVGAIGHRSAFALIVAIFVPGWFVLMIQTRKRIHLIMFTLAISASMFVLLNTYNRLGLIAVVLTCVIYGIRHFRENPKRLILLSTLFFMAYLFLQTRNSTLLSVYSDKFVNMFDAQTAQGNSDLVRANNLIFSLANLIKKPVGNGWSKMPIGSFIIDAHSLYVFLIWAGGLVGIGVIIVISVVSYRKLYIPYHQLDLGESKLLQPLFYSLFAWTIYNLGHTSISAGIFWILLGLLIGTLRKYERKGAMDFRKTHKKYLVNKADFPIKVRRFR